MKNQLFSVSDINFYIKNLLESDVILDDIWVVGELSNVKAYTKGGQIYFTLSDGQSQLSSVMYDTYSSQLPFTLKDGLQVVARGKIKLFHKKGYYVFQCAYMALQGIGNQTKAFEQLKAQLLKEGLFDPERKKSIPKYPEKVGLITGENSAAQWDFVSICHQLTPHIQMILIPAIMQGVQSADSVMRALDQAELYPGLDILFILRGGGSSEDLASFNDEALVRRVARCTLPTISAIGHEVDYTLTDFVADLRMPTPGAAARHIAQPYLEFKTNLTDQLERLPQQFQNLIDVKRDYLMQSLADIYDLIEEKFLNTKQKIEYFMVRLEQSNPLRKIRQGYTITRLLNQQKIIKSIADVSKNQIIVTQVSDGTFQSKII